jgi:MSHA biogenesis protein MshO
VQRGFTLVEAIMVIALTGIIAAVAAVFIRGPIQGYFDTVRRSQLSDVSDFALRRMARDLQATLPNSVRSTDVNNYFLEFLPVRSGGRYRAAGDGGTNPLDLTNSADNSFDVLGPGVAAQAGDSIVIYNTGQVGADAYQSAGTTNRRGITSTSPALPTTAATSITFNMVAGTFPNDTSGQFPRDSSSYRFQVISTPVTYACDAVNGTLWRFSGYNIQAAQPVTLNVSSQLVTASGNVTGQRLATNVVCAADASNIGTGFQVQPGDGLALLRIQLRDSSGESVSLYREVHIDNAP